MNKYFINDREVEKCIFDIILMHNIEKLLPGLREETYDDIFKSTYSHMEDPKTISYKVGKDAFKIIVSPKIDTVTVTITSINPCEHCIHHNQPYWSITSPCTGCGNNKLYGYAITCDIKK